MSKGMNKEITKKVTNEMMRIFKNNHPQNETLDIAIGICTYKRPQMLSKALNELLKLNYPTSRKVGIVIVDNDINESAYKIVANFAEKFNKPIFYFVEEKTGLVNVRNRLLMECHALKANWLAGFDDDDYPDKDWLVNLVSVQKKYNSQAVHGIRYFAKSRNIRIEQFYKKNKNYVFDKPFRMEGIDLKCFATNNYFLDLNFVRKNRIWFDMRFNFIGSEDTDFSKVLYKKGGKIVWTNTALCFESERTERSGFLYNARIAFRHGYSIAVLDEKHNIKIGHMKIILQFIRRFLRLFFFIYNIKRIQKNTIKILATLGKIYYMFGGKLETYKKTDGK